MGVPVRGRTSALVPWLCFFLAVPGEPGDVSPPGAGQNTTRGTDVPRLAKIQRHTPAESVARLRDEPSPIVKRRLELHRPAKPIVFPSTTIAYSGSAIGSRAGER